MHMHVSHRNIESSIKFSRDDSLKTGNADGLKGKVLSLV